MWWPFAWLTLGFVLKWIREACTAIRAKFNEWSPVVFDILLLLSSFLVLWVTFGVWHVSSGQGFLILFFWSFVLIIFKVK